MTPRVSVVIPTYNRADDLVRALRSVQRQTFAAWEAVVVDNHSTDGTVAALEALADPRITMHFVHNQGVIATSRNVGIRTARGEFVAFLDSDDWWTPAKLARSVAALDGGADVVYHDLVIARDAAPGRFARVARTWQVATPAFDDLIQRGNAVQTSSVVVRRALLEQVGGFREDPAMIAIEDFDLWLRLAKSTARFRYLPEALGYYWLAGGNTSTDARTLRVLEWFESSYAAPYRAEHPELDAFWLPYVRGMTQYRVGDRQAARTSLRAVALGRVSPLMALKAMIARVLVAVR